MTPVHVVLHAVLAHRQEPVEESEMTLTALIIEGSFSHNRPQCEDAAMELRYATRYRVCCPCRTPFRCQCHFLRRDRLSRAYANCRRLELLLRNPRQRTGRQVADNQAARVRVAKHPRSRRAGAVRGTGPRRTAFPRCTLLRRQRSAAALAQSSTLSFLRDRGRFGEKYRSR